MNGKLQHLVDVLRHNLSDLGGFLIVVLIHGICKGLQNYFGRPAALSVQENLTTNTQGSTIMSDLEKDAVKALAKEIVDVMLPKIIAAEEARLPVAYQPLAAAVGAAMLPQLQAMLDAKIAAL